MLVKQFQNNRKKIFNQIEDNSFALLHSGYEVFQTADEAYSFVVNNNFYYLTGIDQADVKLIVGKLDNKYVEYLFIDENDEVQAKWVGYSLTKEQASKISGIEVKNIFYNDAFDNFMAQHLQFYRYSMGNIKNLYLDLEHRNFPLYNTFALAMARNIKKTYPALVIKDIYSELIKLRMIKSDLEVELMKKSIETTRLAIENVMRNHDDLHSEKDANAYYNFILDKAGKAVSFPSIMAAGKNGTTLHYVANNNDIVKDSLLLMDVGAYTDHYASDISRTFPVSGKFTPRQKAIYEVVLECNKKCIEFLKAGVSWLEYNNYAKSILAVGCKKLGLIKEDSELERYYYHSIGHSLGLDTHDPDVRSNGILAGMVVTVEPGLYVAEEGIGIRIEDDVLITKEKAICLSQSIIKEVADIEEFMKNK